ncbi:MAG: pyocin knob domain-containing protein, partial [Spirochaetaceae bacterium]|nr:pyocin knob domain-containing protein [Spirochaetaceae bacterium]
AAGFFTSYVGANTNISRQEYRPANSNKVYERYKNGGSWSAWVRTDVAASVNFSSQMSGALWSAASNKRAIYDPTSGMVSISYLVPGGVTWHEADSPLVPQAYRPETTVYGVGVWGGSTTFNNSYTYLSTDGKIRLYYNNNQYVDPAAFSCAVSLTYLLLKP